MAAPWSFYSLHRKGETHCEQDHAEAFLQEEQSCSLELDGQHTHHLLQARECTALAEPCREHATKHVQHCSYIESTASLVSYTKTRFQHAKM